MRQIVALMSVLTAMFVTLPAQAKDQPTEGYVHEPMPPGFKVVVAEFEGPVFADAKGRTLYNWPRAGLRNGDAGEQKGKPTCDDHKYTDNAGLMSPYPAGLELPEVETRPGCTDVWPPVLAVTNAKPVGKWTILERKDGRKQWAYDGYALYTSVLDRGPGDVFGGSMRKGTSEAGAQREPVGPPPNIPPQFAVHTVATGRLLIIGDTGRSVYYSDHDKPGKSNCDQECLHDWVPVLAPESVNPQGDWSIVESSPGVKQWAFRKMPVYTHTLDSHGSSLEGSDAPGWHNAYTQMAPPAPVGFTVNDNQSGQVLGDAKGMTIYIYNCNDDAVDQLACNHPDTPQEYRLAVCGRGDPELCLKNFPYVIAPKGTKSNSHTWSTLDIDPHTGKKAAHNALGALHVWAYRDRPVYYCGRDKKPGDIECDTWGEFNGARNGYKAFWLRDDFGGNAGSSRVL
jgi:predicted lipoprotein with Yx(FWY)xxD motif